MNKKQIFKKGSTTYFYSSFFFPKKVLKEVTTLYAFVRIADDYVDEIPQQKEKFYAFKMQFEQAWNGQKTHNSVVDDFVALAQKRSFEKSWVDAFFASMEMDLVKSDYNTMEELLDYIYGSAEVIGLMMSRIMQLSDEATDSAKLLGRAMQYINFLRDLNEDLSLGRRYLPTSEWSQYGLTELSQNEAINKKEAFIDFYKNQINQYKQWDDQARKGFSFLPLRFRIPIRTASDMYGWTAKKVYQNPLIVFEKKMKPPKWLILLTGIKNILTFYA